MTFLASSPNVLSNLRRYLLSHGWIKVEHLNKRIEWFQSKPDETGDYASICIPALPELRDAERLINEAIQLIASYECRPINNIIDHVVHWDRDILRSRFFKMLGNEESLPLGVAADVISRLKEFIGYAAYTHTEPRPFFEKAGSISKSFSDKCLFGHTFRGSFGLTVECPIVVTTVLPIDGLEPVVPLERQVFERIAKGLDTLRESIIQDTIDPMLADYHIGFSANMYRKLSEIYEISDGRRVEYDISWSPQLRSPCETTWKPIVFDGRAYELTRIAAAELEKTEICPDTRITSRIVILKSDTPPGLDDQAKFEHAITMLWEREKGISVKIRILLSPDQYKLACDAHKNGKAVQVSGIPQKEGKFWVLTQAHDFLVINS